MRETEVLIVGGGPAGSACARRLVQAGRQVVVVDQVDFPRVKPCAGWITPQVLRDLGIRPEEYPHGLRTFDGLEITIKRFHFRLPTRQYAIRRVEFDDWMLRRSGAEVVRHTVRKIEAVDGGYSIDDVFHTRFLVGAGGTQCPVYRTFFREGSPRDRRVLIAAMEEEFAYDWKDGRCQLWFLQNGLPGYSWYIPKANGIVNVGVGGKAEEMNSRGDHLKNHWAYLIEQLEREGLVRGHAYQPVAHTYFLRRPATEIHRENVYLAGDAAGLATLDMGEGISAAIRSGLRAAESILTGQPYSLQGVRRYSFPEMVFTSRRL